MLTSDQTEIIERLKDHLIQRGGLSPERLWAVAEIDEFVDLCWTHEDAPDPATWSCKIGELPRARLGGGYDLPMREAVACAYNALFGVEPDFIFSGWGASLTKTERAVVNDE